MGSDVLIRHVEDRLGTQLGGTTTDGILTVQSIFCLGMCRKPPSMMLDDKPYGSATLQIADSVIDSVLTPSEACDRLAADSP